MMKAELMGIGSTVLDYESFMPTDPLNFQITIALKIGPAGSNGGDRFYLSVCTPKWLAERTDAPAIEWCTARVLMHRWDRPALERFLREWCAGEGATDWPSLAQRLGLRASWEFGGLAI